MAADTESVRSFIGRTEVVAALHRRFEDARAGAGGVTLLVGDTGVGKSALVEDLVRDIRGHGMTVLIGRALALDDPPPFSLIRSAIESEPDDAAASPGGAAPFGAERILIGFVPGLRGADFPPPVTIEQRLLEALGGTGERVDMSGDRVLTGIADRLLKFTQRGPIALVLEDLHRSDESSLAAIEFLANELQNRPLWILATSRPYASLSESGRARLEAFERATHARRIVLRPMNSGETADYLRLTEPSREFSPSEVARRYSETGGNPLLLEQLDRRTDSTGAVRRPAGTNLPPLDEDAQRTIDVAAVLGSEFPFGLLLRASGEEDEERLTETVDRLVGQGLLIERPGELLAFPDDRLRAAAYARLPERRRRLLHWTAGESLEAMGTGGLSTIYALSRHFYLGQAGKKSVQYNRLAAEIAERALAPEVARDHFSRALESQRTLSSEDHDGESQLVLELARTAEELGHLKEAEEVLRGFLEREKDHTALSARRRATLEIFLARVLADQGDMPGSAELAKKVLASPGLQDQLLVQIGGHHELGLALYYEGQYSEALAQHTEEIRLARELGNPLLLLRARIWRVASLAMMGPTEQAVAEAREVTAERDRLGSVRESAQAHLFLGDMLADARCTPAQRSEAVAQYAQAIGFAEKAQDPRRIGWALYKTSELDLEAGRIEEAVECVQQASDIFGRIGDRVGLSMSLKVRGQIAMGRGAYDLAETDLLEAHRLLRGLHHTLEEIDVVFRLAQLSDARGDRASARRHVAELVRQNLPTTRPDLAEDFERLTVALGAKGNEDAVP
ncbi:MAG: AAA family ATPase [Thermoplasmata archaeon]